MYKFYLIYYYHDTYVYEFNNWEECEKFLKKIKEEYKYDRDFHYKVVKGLIVDYQLKEFVYE